MGPQITVGAGPLRGSFGGQAIHEEFQDWDAYSVKGLDPENDQRFYADGKNSSRDLVAFYSHRNQDDVFLRVDFRDLAYGAEVDGLDLVVLIDFAPGGQSQVPLLGLNTAMPFECALIIRDTQNFEISDGQGTVLADPANNSADFLGTYMRSDLDALETGFKSSVLTNLGWNGVDALRFQVFTLKDGEAQVADAFLEIDARDGSLDQHCEEHWTAGRAHFASVTVGNRAVLNASLWNALIHDANKQSSRGTPAGLHRSLETHTLLQVPLNIHMSGAFMSGLLWSSSNQAEQDGPAFIQRVREFFDGQIDNGEGAFIPGTFADHMMPYFENKNGFGANSRLMAMTQKLYKKVLGVNSGPMFWSSERVLRGQTFEDILKDEHGQATGFEFTVLDHLTHIGEWFGYGEVFNSVKTHKINRINGVGCFLINHGPSQFQFEPQDGGANDNLRRLFLIKAMDPDQEQVIVTAADWEVLSGNKDPNKADQYFDSLRWMANRAWIEIVTLEDIAQRQWGEVDRGFDATLKPVASDWLHHASEQNYDNWYYGHPLEESFASHIPELRPGQNHARAMGDVATRGTLFGDSWFEVSSAPPGRLQELAEMVFASALYRTAWHSEDMHNLHRNAQGGYDVPDQTRDNIIGFAYGLQTHIGDSAIVARAAHWAASVNLSSQSQAVKEDVDLDGEDEYLLFNDRLFAVFENDGGRLKAAFVRDQLTSEGYLIIGSLMSFPGGRGAVEFEGDENSNTNRNSFLKDWWLSNPGTNQYVNDDYIAQVNSASSSWTFQSSDQKISKTVELLADRLIVRYNVDPNAGKLYIRGSFSPNLKTLAEKGQQALQVQDNGQSVTFTTTDQQSVDVELEYASQGHNSTYNASASDGKASSPRTVAYSQMVEVFGSGQFSFAIRARVR